MYSALVVLVALFYRADVAAFTLAGRGRTRVNQFSIKSSPRFSGLFMELPEWSSAPIISNKPEAEVSDSLQSPGLALPPTPFSVLYHTIYKLINTFLFLYFTRAGDAHDRD